MSRSGVVTLVAAVGLAVAAASDQPDFGARMDSLGEYLKQDTAMQEKSLEMTRESGAWIKDLKHCVSRGLPRTAQLRGLGGR